MSHAQAIDIWTISFNPLDFPGKYVARKHLVPGGVTNEFYVADTINEARAHVPPHLINFGRDPTDQAVIVESWI